MVCWDESQLFNLAQNAALPVQSLDALSCLTSLGCAKEHLKVSCVLAGPHPCWQLWLPSPSSQGDQAIVPVSSSAPSQSSASSNAGMPTAIGQLALTAEPQATQPGRAQCSTSLGCFSAVIFQELSGRSFQGECLSSVV